MGGEWIKTTLGEAVNFKNGKGLKNIFYDEDGAYPVWGANGQISRTNYICNNHSVIVIGRVGAYCGSVHAVLEPNWVTDNAIVATPKESNDINFLYYLLKNIKPERASIGSAQPLVTQSGLKALGFLRPPLPEQQAIAHILGSLDDKIELNRQMNETLEEMARTIFKSWFVDFDPVKAKMEGRDTGLPKEIADIFPDRLVESELGMIPEGWEIGVIGDIASVSIGGQWGEETQKDNSTGVICLRGCDMDDLRHNGFAHRAPVRFVKENAFEKRLPKENDVLIASSGAGPCGRPLWCSQLINDLYEHPVIYSNFVKKISAYNKEYAVYIDRLLYEKFLDKSIKDFITGTSVPNLDINGLLSHYKLVIPSQKIMDIFYQQNMPYFQNLYSKENITLSNIRDTLLPKLISGELRVPEAEKIAEEYT